MTAKRLKESDMDFKALMTKLETIDKRQVLNESATSPAKKTRKVHLNENIDMKSSIARALMQEFGVNEAEAADDGVERNADAVDSQGNPIQAASGGTVKSAGKAKDPAGDTPELNIGQGREDQLPSDDARSPDGQSGMAPSAPVAQVVPVQTNTPVSVPQAQDEFAGVDSAIGQQATQAAADANPEVYGYGGGPDTPQAQANAAANAPSQGSDGGERTQQAMARPTAQTQPAAPAGGARPPVTPAPGEGPTGVALAKFGVSKQDRLNQQFVDSILGPGKFKAGSAQANTALLAHFQKQPAAAQAAAPKPAPAAAPKPAPGADQGGPVEENLNLIKRLAGL